MKYKTKNTLSFWNYFAFVFWKKQPTHHSMLSDACKCTSQYTTIIVIVHMYDLSPNVEEKLLQPRRRKQRREREKNEEK